LHESFGAFSQGTIAVISVGTGALFGLVALLLIESMRGFERALRRFESHPYLLAAAGGVALIGFYLLVGDRYAGLGTETLSGVLAGTVTVALGGFLYKILATSITLETGGSGGIVTPIFFVGATSGAAMGRLFHLPVELLAAFGFVAVLAAAANTPIAAAVMAIEVLPPQEGVYAALAAATAFLMVGHRSVYASQKLGLSKSAGIEFELGGTVGELDLRTIKVRPGSITERVHRLGRAHEAAPDDPHDTEPGG
jgi:H+/Cl- antiporter ClcA